VLANDHQRLDAICVSAFMFESGYLHIYFNINFVNWPHMNMFC